MNLDKLVVVSGISGVFKMVANRDNGMIIEDLRSGKRQFASIRKHQFSPLESITIFTNDGDSIELKKVFENIRDKSMDVPPVDPESSSKELFEYFTLVLPEFDTEKVKAGDIRKILKWYTFLDGTGHLHLDQTPDETETLKEPETETTHDDPNDN